MNDRESGFSFIIHHFFFIILSILSILLNFDLGAAGRFGSMARTVNPGAGCEPQGTYVARTGRSVKRWGLLP
jgi:hypothetical protein